jgi:hypothetical protein
MSAGHHAIKSRVGPMLGFKKFVSAQIMLADVELLTSHPARAVRASQAWSRREDGAAGDLECRARRLTAEAFKIDLGLRISTLHSSPPNYAYRARFLDGTKCPGRQPEARVDQSCSGGSSA